MQIINLFAGPGCGKSTTAAGLFYEMKLRHMNVELVTEYAKDKTWEEHDSALADQLYILAKQHRRISRLKGKVDWVVTDGPILQGLAYVPDDYFAHFKPLVLEMVNTYNNHNILLQRDSSVTYQSQGRSQDLHGAQRMDLVVERLFQIHNVPYSVVKVGPNTVRDILVMTKLTA